MFHLMYKALFHSNYCLLFQWADRFPAQLYYAFLDPLMSILYKIHAYDCMVQFLNRHKRFEFLLLWCQGTLDKLLHVLQLFPKMYCLNFGRVRFLKILNVDILFICSCDVLLFIKEFKDNNYMLLSIKARTCYLVLNQE